MSSSASVIGEGSYGCVHKPMLECNQSKKASKFKKNKYISKFMLKDEALIELSQYLLISSIDKKKEYYLGKPLKCKPKRNLYNLNSTKKCDLYNSSKIKTLKKRTRDYYSNFLLLILPDGGLTLSKFAESLFKQPIHQQKEQLSHFWKESPHIFKGILLFQKHGIMHHDVKMQNILYDSKKREIRFIDFGFMQKIEDVKEKSKKNENRIANYPFWTYPFEFPYLNKESYMKIATLSENEKKQYFITIQEQLKNSSSKLAISCHIFFDYICENLHQTIRTHIIDSFFNDFRQFILYEMTPDNYDAFLEKSLHTLDLFGVGISLQYMLCHSMNYFHPAKILALQDCFFNMMRPSVFKRYTLDQAFEQFTQIMELEPIEEVKDDSIDSYNDSYNYPLVSHKKNIKNSKVYKKIDKNTRNQLVEEQEIFLEETYSKMNHRK